MSIKTQESVSCIAPNKVWSLTKMAARSTTGSGTHNSGWVPIRGMDMSPQIFYVCVVSCSTPFGWIDLLASSPAK